MYLSFFDRTIFLETQLILITVAHQGHNYSVATNSLLVYLSSCLKQGTAKGPFRSSSQTATCHYHSNRSKVDAIPLSALPNETTSELAGLSHTIPF